MVSLAARLLVIYIALSTLADAAPSKQALNQLRKQKTQLTIDWKHYHISDAEPISLYGGKRRHFVTPTIYWGEGGYGAVSGKRAGYLEGGIFLGYQHAIFNSVLIDTRLFTGAGGGGSAPQGSGFIMHYTVGLGRQWTPAISSLVETGYISFLNGNISSMTIGFNININYWDLIYEAPKHAI